MEDGKIVDYGHLGGGHLGVTKVKLGLREVSVPAIAMPTLQPEPEVGDGLGALHPDGRRRTGMPAPRHVHGKPFFQISSALAWTTLSLTLYADGCPSTSSKAPARFLATGSIGRGSSSEERPHRLQGVVPQGVRRAHALGQGGLGAVRDRRRDGLEREISPSIMRSGSVLEASHLEVDDELVEQGEQSDELYLLLDGVLAAEVDGETVAEIGPGAVLGERRCSKVARTATLRAVTPVKVVSISSGELDPSVLQELAVAAARTSSPVRGADGGHDLLAVIHPQGRSEALATEPEAVDRTSYRRSSLSPRSRAARVTR